ncbi:hypothetical protein BDV23DRAFT_95898 [Aspergillus alliaceus]|uniref:Zn(2)-C6 fungal-type domain-containing protein n=1 Tax=Petromyces alliaceus TaxID=209559 RepID=A0A5N7CMM4_PETAA|nr:hypothetical protein BDV23DRAFT_95898 [Aspergillus alliaceus]
MSGRDGRKRGRASQYACVPCHQRKVKCDWSTGKNKCLACEMRKNECLLRERPMKESVDGADDPGSSSVFLSTANSEELSPYALPCFQIWDYLTDNPHAGTKRSLSLLSPEGKQWLHDRTGIYPSGSLSSSSAAMNRCTTFPNRGFLPFPPKSVTVELLQLYFAKMHSICPVFDEDVVTADVQQLFDPTDPDLPGEIWTSMHAILALACTLKPIMHHAAGLHFKSALSSLSSIIILPPSFRSVQALLAMALFLMGTLMPHPASNLLSLSIRLLHNLGPNGESSSCELYNRLIAISHGLDIDIALRFGIPPNYCVYGWDIPLPMDDIDCASIRRDIDEERRIKYKIFRSIRELTMIKRLIYAKLYSTTAKDLNETAVMKIVSDLGQMLQQWLARLPYEYRPQSSGTYTALKKRTGFYLMYLHFVYYHSLLVLHRQTVGRAPWIKRDSENHIPRARLDISAPDPRVVAPTNICEQAARASIRLVQHLPVDNIICSNMFIYFPVFALIILSSIIVKEPRRATAASDLELLGSIERHLRTRTPAQPDHSVQGLIDYCSTFRTAADKAVSNAFEQCATAAS